jgi:hypothetical protein
MIEALRKLANHIYSLDSGSLDAKLLFGAADEIERLHAEAEEARRLSLELYAATTGPALRRAG